MAFLETNPGPVKWAMEQTRRSSTAAPCGRRSPRRRHGVGSGSASCWSRRACSSARRHGREPDRGTPLSRMTGRSAPQLHYIGGEFRPGRAGTTFETLNPVTNLPIADVAEGLTRGRGRRGRGRAEPRSTKARGRGWREGARGGPAPGRDGDPRATPTSSSRSSASTSACRSRRCAGLAARAAENFDFFAAQIEELTGRRVPRRRRLPQLHDPQAGRRRRADHAVERAADALDVADRALPRRRQHDRAQAGRVVAADGDAARGAVRRGRRARRASSTSSTASARRRARALVAHPDVQLVSFTGESGDRVDDHGERRCRR